MARTRIASSPSHLLRHRNRFYFRMSVPPDLRPRMGRREVRLSLGRRDLKEARVLAIFLGGITINVFGHLRNGEGPLAELKMEQIKALVDQWLRQCVEEHEQTRAQRPRAWSEERLEEYLDGLGYAELMVRKDWELGNHQGIQDHAQEVLQNAALSSRTDSQEFKRLCHELLRAQAECLAIEQKRACCDYSDPYANESPVPPTTTNGIPEPEAPLLSEVVEAYKDFKVSRGKWGASSVKDTPPKLHRFILLVGDIPINRLNRDHVRNYRDNLAKLPARMTQKREYKTKSVSQILQMEIPQEKLLEPKTLKLHYEAVVSMFKWARREGYPVIDGLGDLLTHKDYSPSVDTSKRGIFDADDLKRLFGSELYLHATEEQPSRFWVPLLSLYTGARLEELCRLDVDDVLEKDGVWCINIHENEETGRTVKTKAGIRLVPLHPALLDKLGFLDYVKRQRSMRHKQLFPELTATSSGKVSGKVGSWFGRHRKKLDITMDDEGRGKVFHGFRHTAYTALREAQVRKEWIKLVVGHAPGEGYDEMDETYNKYKPSAKLLFDEVISKLDFDIDLTALAQSPHCGIDPGLPTR